MRGRIEGEMKSRKEGELKKKLVSERMKRLQNCQREKKGKKKTRRGPREENQENAHSSPLFVSQIFSFRL
jgi:hypothetical protein